jgi:acyl-CoA thioesterase FadM
MGATSTGWEHRFSIGPADLDYLGHLTAAAYLAFFEEARVGWLSAVWDTELPSYVVARQELVFRREVMTSDNPLRISISVGPIDGSTFEVSEALYTADGQCRTTSWARLVAWDRAERKARPLSRREVDGLGSLPAGEGRASNLCVAAIHDEGRKADA